MEIRTDLPIPEHNQRGVGGRRPRYPFAEMPVGGSIGVTPKESERAINAARMWRKRHAGWDYTGRRVGDEYRIWRIA